MGNLLSSRAYAKVNLHLSVGAPFADGYHPIESIFSLVDLSDRIQMTWEKSDSFCIEVTGLESYCDVGGDTLTKAATLWYAKSKLPLSLKVHCEKHIPVKAGLGGGSSDAAALLTLLQQAAGQDALSSAELQEIALQVGSDVPFFLTGFSCALVEGRGEQVRELNLGAKHLVLAMPKGYSVSTKHAYGLLDAMRKNKALGHRVSLQAVLGALGNVTPSWKSVFFNDFEKCTDNPEFYDVVASLAKNHRGYGSLTGSGSCWFFISENDKSVVELYQDICQRFEDSVQLWCTKLI